MRDKGMLNLFNDLVGAAEEQEWHGKAERPSGLEVDDQLDPGGLSHRQVTCQLWDRDFSHGDQPKLSSDGRRRLLAPRAESRRAPAPERRSDDEQRQSGEDARG